MGVKASKNVKFGLVGGSVFVLSYLSFKILKDNLSGRSKANSENDQLESEQQFQQDRQEVEQSIRTIESKITTQSKQIKVEFDQEYISLSTLIDILTRSPCLVSESFIEETQSNRKQRRMLFHYEPDKYIKCIIDYHKFLILLQEKGERKLLQQLNLTEDLLDRSLHYYMQIGYIQEMVVLQTLSTQKLKFTLTNLYQLLRESMESKVDISLQQLKEILQYQLTYLIQKPQILLDCIEALSREKELYQLIPSVVNTVMLDAVFEQYNVDEEDILKSSQKQESLSDSEIQMISIQVGNVIEKLVQEIIPNLFPK